MREITDHMTNPANEQLRIAAADAPGPGGANHLYFIEGFDTVTNPSVPRECAYQGMEILFQNGAIGEVGVNGVTHEALLAILIDRLEAFQKGPYACTENAIALDFLRGALFALHSRTRKRQARGVEGTTEV